MIPMFLLSRIRSRDNGQSYSFCGFNANRLRFDFLGFDLGLTEGIGKMEPTAFTKISQPERGYFNVTFRVPEYSSAHYLDIGETHLSWVTRERLLFETRGFRNLGYRLKVRKIKG